MGHGFLIAIASGRWLMKIYSDDLLHLLPYHQVKIQVHQNLHFEYNSHYLNFHEPLKPLSLQIANHCLISSVDMHLLAAVNFAHFYKLSSSRNIWIQGLAFGGYHLRLSQPMLSLKSWMVAYSGSVSVVAATACMMKNKSSVPDRTLAPGCSG
jgi:hypothetical protein